MKSTLKTTARAIWNATFQTAPLRLVSSLTPARLIAPCYHLVSDRSPAHVRHLFQCRTVNQFKAELDWLLKRFKPISLEELSSSVAAQIPLPPNSLFISFDDGLRECLDVVAPICLAKGVPVTFFLASGFLGNRSLCFRHKASLLLEEYSRSRNRNVVRTPNGVLASAEEFRAFVLQVKYANAFELDECAKQLGLCFDEYLSRERPYLDDADVATLIRQGFSIGGHSVDHPLYGEISLDQQITQTSDCMHHLKAKFPLPVSSFAFPFVGDGVSEEFTESILSSHTAGLIFYTGALRPDHNGRVIWRFGVELGDRAFADTWKDNVGTQQRDRMRAFLKSRIKLIRN